MRFNAPVSLTREEALATLGVSYAHHGSFRDPIVEKLGAVETAPPSRVQRFPTEKVALAYVQELANRHATVELTKIEARQQAAPVTDRLVTWLAENWSQQRKREVGRLATRAIVDDQIRDLKTLQGDGYKPEITRLPDGIRLPFVLSVGTPVWIVDITDFPARPPCIIEDRIASITVRDDLDHPTFTAVCRYALAATDGSFSCDYTPDDEMRLDCPTTMFRGRLRKEQAQADLDEFNRNILGAIQPEGEATHAPSAGKVIPLDAEERWKARSLTPVEPEVPAPSPLPTPDQLLAPAPITSEVAAGRGDVSVIPQSCAPDLVVAEATPTEQASDPEDSLASDPAPDEGDVAPEALAQELMPEAQSDGDAQVPQEAPEQDVAEPVADVAPMPEFASEPEVVPALEVAPETVSFIPVPDDRPRLMDIALFHTPAKIEAPLNSVDAPEPEEEVASDQPASLPAILIEPEANGQLEEADEACGAELAAVPSVALIPVMVAGHGADEADAGDDTLQPRAPRIAVVVRIKDWFGRKLARRAKIERNFDQVGSADILMLDDGATPPLAAEHEVDHVEPVALSPVEEFMLCGYTIRRPSTISGEDSLISLLRERVKSAA